MDWNKVVIGRRARVRLPSGFAEGEVVEVAGRVLGRAREPGKLPRFVPVDSGWAKVELDDHSIVVVHQPNIVEMLPPEDA